MFHFYFPSAQSWQVNLPGLEDPYKPLAEMIHMHVEQGFCDQSVPELLPL